MGQVASDQALAPEDFAGRVHNFVHTEDGGLRTVVGPVEFRPRAYVDAGGADQEVLTYEGEMRGVSHCLVDGRNVLLGHFDNKIKVFEGWRRQWRTIIGPDFATFLTGDHLKSRAVATPLAEGDERATPNTQFVTTTTGVIIVPQGERAYFFDGNVILPLGYDTIPPSPVPVGENKKHSSSSANTAGGDSPANANVYANRGGYTMQGDGSHECFGDARVGSVHYGTGLDVDMPTSNRKVNALGGVLLMGQWEATTQWVDYFGNLSPCSVRSSPNTTDKEDNLTKERAKYADKPAEQMKVHLAWTDIAPGPTGTIGRILGHTKDLLNSGDNALYQVPSHATPGPLAFVTIPDNTSEVMPYNMPDTWLTLKADEEVTTVPRMRNVATFAGRTFCDDDNEPGTVKYSLPGQYGTFRRNDKLAVDLTGGRITAIAATESGVLVFTRTTTTYIVFSDDGQRFVPLPLSTTIGCIAPDSVAVLPSGITVWLSEEGFHVAQGRKLQSVQDGQRKDILSRLNRTYASRACAAVDSRLGEYRCWVPLDGSTTNNICCVFNGKGWATRDDVAAHAVCVTKDARRLMMAFGYAPAPGGGTYKSLWVLDHDGLGRRPAEHEAVFESVWLRNRRAHRTASPKTVRLWLREGSTGEISLQTFRGGRAHPPLQTSTRSRDAEDVQTPRWDADDLGGRYKHTEVGWVSKHWVARANVWEKVDISVPSTNTVKFRVSGVGDWELVLARYEETNAYGGGMKHQGGS
jgi:hypothetical protein